VTKPKYGCATVVRLVLSNEAGVIIGRAEYLESEPSYYVRYKAADGRQVEAWWGESAIVPAE
jgi:hypothetical protein